MCWMLFVAFFLFSGPVEAQELDLELYHYQGLLYGLDGIVSSLCFALGVSSGMRV